MQTNYCDVYLLRHGETDWNLKGKIQGYDNDIPLNDTGKFQAREVKENLKNIQFSAAYSSDLSRASQTAAIILESQNLKIITAPDLRERRMGSWEGKSTLLFKEWFREQNVPSANFTREEYLSFKTTKNMENYEEVYQRVSHFLISKAVLHLGSTVLCASHGGVIRAFLYKHCYKMKSRWLVENGAYLTLRINEIGQIALIHSNGVKEIPEGTII